MLCSHLLITEDITLHMSFFFFPSHKKLMQTASIFSNVWKFFPSFELLLTFSACHPEGIGSAERQDQQMFSFSN